MGLFSFIGDIFGGNSRKKAADKAAAQQNEALARAQAQLAAQTTANNQALSPYTSAGAEATGAIEGLLGLNGNDAQAQAIQALEGSPLFKSLFRNGQEAILQNASATGGLRGGNVQSSLADFGADTLTKVIQQQLANLGGLSSQGLSAVNTGVQAGNQNTGAIANASQQQGVNSASATIAKALADQQMIKSFFNLGNDAVSALMGQPGTSSGGSSGGGINWQNLGKVIF